jgi:hypothetical protein
VQATYVYVRAVGRHGLAGRGPHQGPAAGPVEVHVVYLTWYRTGQPVDLGASRALEESGRDYRRAAACQPREHAWGIGAGIELPRESTELGSRETRDSNGPARFEPAGVNE